VTSGTTTPALEAPSHCQATAGPGTPLGPKRRRRDDGDGEAAPSQANEHPTFISGPGRGGRPTVSEGIRASLVDQPDAMYADPLRPSAAGRHTKCDVLLLGTGALMQHWGAFANCYWSLAPLRISAALTRLAPVAANDPTTTLLPPLTLASGLAHCIWRRYSLRFTIEDAAHATQPNRLDVRRLILYLPNAQLITLGSPTLLDSYVRSMPQCSAPVDCPCACSDFLHPPAREYRPPSSAVPSASLERTAPRHIVLGCCTAQPPAAANNCSKHLQQTTATQLKDAHLTRGILSPSRLTLGTNPQQRRTGKSGCSGRRSSLPSPACLSTTSYSIRTTGSTRSTRMPRAPTTTLPSTTHCVRGGHIHKASLSPRCCASTKCAVRL